MMPPFNFRRKTKLASKTSAEETVPLDRYSKLAERLKDVEIAHAGAKVELMNTRRNLENMQRERDLLSEHLKQEVDAHNVTRKAYADALKEIILYRENALYTNRDPE